ncbi:hypothetical protein [Nostocoides australiense]
MAADHLQAQLSALPAQGVLAGTAPVAVEFRPPRPESVAAEVIPA